jgi:glycosyltransferase involved in cell wall biosynthesis
MSSSNGSTILGDRPTQPTGSLVNPGSNASPGSSARSTSSDTLDLSRPPAIPRVCILTETYYPVVGGGEVQARNLACDLMAAGARAIVISRRTDDKLARREDVDGVPVYRVGPSGKGRSKKWSLVSAVVPPLFKLRDQYDVILVCGYRILGIPAVVVSKLLGKRCVLKADSNGEMSGAFFAAGLAQHGMTPSSWIARSFVWARNHILRRADAFVAISSTIAAELEAHGVARARIHAIPNGVDTHLFRPVTPSEKMALRHRLGLSPTMRIAVYTGRLVSYKGLPLLLRAWKEIQTRHASVGLVLVGSGGLDMHNCEADLRQYVAAHGLGSSVFFTGNVRNVHEYLQAADLFVFPTEKEAFSVSLIEAMACGLPCVATTVGGANDIVIDRHNGLLVPPSDLGRLLAAIDALLSDTSQVTALGAMAAQTARERCAREMVARQYAELVSGLTSYRAANS